MILIHTTLDLQFMSYFVFKKDRYLFIVHMKHLGRYLLTVFMKSSSILECKDTHARFFGYWSP